MFRIIDLSHPIASGMPVYPGDAEVDLSRVRHIADSGCNLTTLAMSAHAGTHLDAPFHLIADGSTIEQVPLEALAGPAEILDLGELTPDTGITAAMLDRFSGRVGNGCRVILRTGWSRRFGRPEFFAKHPSLTQEAATWLVDRKIALLGMEEPSLSTTENHVVHRIILGVGIPVIENLTSLERIPGERAFIVALPLNLAGCDGAPVRVIAIEGHPF